MKRAGKVYVTQWKKEVVLLISGKNHLETTADTTKGFYLHQSTNVSIS